MGDRSAIEWTDASWNPIRARRRSDGRVGWFCTHASEGCRNCYAERLNRRLGTGVDFKAQLLPSVELFLDEAILSQPLRWRRARMVFPCSMTDLFGEFVATIWIDRMFAVMALAGHHTFQVTTKRPDRMRAWYAGGGLERAAALLEELKPAPTWNGSVYEARRHIAQGVLPNVWLGISAEDHPNFVWRWDHLQATPAAIRWVSAEPLLGAIDMSGPLNSGRLHWVVAGGESGSDARPMHPAWVRQVRDACAYAGVPLLFKQWGEWAPSPFFEKVMASDGLTVFWPDGSIGSGRAEQRGGPGVAARRLGKKKSGRLLDGRLHHDFPLMEWLAHVA